MFLYSVFSLLRINKTGNVHISVILRRVHVTIVAVEKQGALHILSL
jgi:hypothetical protein